MSYWVVGGHYANTKFEEIKQDYKLEKYGPFNSYEEAKKNWDFYSWKFVDNCYVRYIILPRK